MTSLLTIPGVPVEAGDRASPTIGLGALGCAWMVLTPVEGAKR